MLFSIYVKLILNCLFDRRMKLPIVREDYLVECFRKQKKLPFHMYMVEALGGPSSVATVKVKGQSAVHESSGMQDTGHILEDGKSIYNTTLNLSDLSTGVNRWVYNVLSCCALTSSFKNHYFCSLLKIGGFLFSFLEIF